MTVVTRTVPALSLLWGHSAGSPDDLLRAALSCLRQPHGDGLIVEWTDRPEGLFTLLGAAAKAQRVLFPARWIPARPPAQTGCGDEGRILALARSDRALHRLFGASGPDFVEGGFARPDEPLLLLGVEGDVVTCPTSSDPSELGRRAERWLRRLGPERVALTAPAGAGSNHPLVELARRRRVPLVALLDESDPLTAAPDPTLQSPLLWTDFQLDTEHRLPDAGFVPALDDLLRRGSLLLERVLYDRLPSSWREQADQELRALHFWHVSPLLRRFATLIQALSPLEGVQIERPLSDLDGVCAYLLGLSGRRPAGPLEPRRCARALASGLHARERILRVRMHSSAWPRVRGRLLSWAEGGHLALCAAAGDVPGASESTEIYCFSGQPLSQRVDLTEQIDGFPALRIGAADRRALGWFDIELAVVEDSPSTPPRSEGPADPEKVVPIHFPVSPADDEQLELELGGSA